jgi:hypothetical protein
MDLLLGKKTYIGIIITVLGMILGRYGIQLTGDDQATLIDGTSKLLEVLGPLIAWYGKWAASKRAKKDVAIALATPCPPDAGNKEVPTI